MGIKLTEITPAHDIEIEELRGKVIVIDGFLVLYQFLSTIRQPDGAPLLDSNGRVTSHLQGLFARSTNLMQKGLKLAFVFDGDAPALKKKVRQQRQALKEQAQQKYDAALTEENVELMKKYAGRTTRLTPEIVGQAKQLLEALGLPWVQAPSEGEAQAAAMVAAGDAYAVGTQDADALMFGAPRIIKNLTISERKKMPGKLAYAKVTPQLVERQEVLRELGISSDQLIVLAMLVGTDFNPGGIKGIGAKKALKLVNEISDFDELFTRAKWSESFDMGWQEVFDTIKNIPTTRDYTLRWSPPSLSKTRQLLCDEFDFSVERVESALEKIQGSGQTGLGQWV